jgi:hypothetical protein
MVQSKLCRLARAYNVSGQLYIVWAKYVEKSGLGMDACEHLYAGRQGRIDVLKCACAGLFLQSATRISTTDVSTGSGRMNSSRGRYKTEVGGELASVHSTSTLFGRNPTPKCVVYSELLVTEKNYLRSVTQMQEEWLKEVAPDFFPVHELDCEVVLSSP